MESQNIIGYADPLSSCPGEIIAIKVSCSRKEFTSRVLRLHAGYKHPKAPSISHQLVDEIPLGTHPGIPQYSRIGSFARIQSWNQFNLDLVDSLSISFWCQPTLPLGAKHNQFLFSSFDAEQFSGFECLLDEAGHILLRLGGADHSQEVRLATKLTKDQWYHLHFTIEPRVGTVKLSIHTKAKDIGQRSIDFEEGYRLAQEVRIASSKPLTIASDSSERFVSTCPVKSHTFNGKVDSFKVEMISNGESHVLLDLDFSLEMSTDKVRDVSHGLSASLINSPTRAVTGYDWDASQSDWTRSSYGYGAIHFHDDDLDDAMWDNSFELELPRILRSGCYAVLVDDGETTDFIPFFVEPNPDAKDAPPVALIMPTFTYAGKW